MPVSNTLENKSTSVGIFMSLSQYMGLLAGAFQLVAYLIYIRYFLKDAIRPNAASWVMFSYGTAFMVFLEWQNGATWDLLVLPFACATMSLIVALMCLGQRVKASTNALEKGSFAADVGLTVGYLALRSTPAAGPFFNAGFIIAGNLTTVTAFLPILWSTWKNPDNEKAAPWVFWTIAYTFLIISTFLAVGLSSPTLYIYPVLNFIVHVGMAIFILRVPRIDREFMRNDENVYVALSEIAGMGIFAATSFKTGDAVILLKGAKIIHPSPLNQSPNWVGIDNDMWIDPEYPVSYLNHSCEPNAAFSENLLLRALRPIARDEEITMDYSTTEADLTWRMDCACGVPTCRETLTSIQIAFGNNAQPPPALPAMQEIWRKSQKLRNLKQPDKTSAEKKVLEVVQ